MSARQESTAEAPTRPILRKLAQSVVARTVALGLRGRRREAAVLDCFLGAAFLAAAEHGDDHPLTKTLSLVCAMQIMPRGFAAAEELAREREEPAG